MTHRQTTSLAMMHLQMTEMITKSHPIGLEGCRSDSERVFQHVEIVCEKYHVCICHNAPVTCSWPPPLLPQVSGLLPLP
jgi:hypothetical protein